MDNPIHKNCRECGDLFLVSTAEIDFLDKVSPLLEGELFKIPPPEKCAGCREQERLAFRNEWHYFRRKCSKTAKDLLSIYHKDSPYIVFDPEVWWSDEYDPLTYGREFDFQRPFFEQLHELHQVVPKAAIQNAKSENSAYTNYSNENKNCYLCVGSGNNEDCYYCSRVSESKSVCDGYNLLKCEFCYECCSGSSLNTCLFTSNCHNSSFLTCCDDCIGCHDCYGCVGLRNQRYHIFNKPHSREEYVKFLSDRSGRPGLEETFYSLQPVRNEYLVNCEESSGNHLVNCFRCISCFGLKESRDCRYVGSGREITDCIDCNFMDKCELLYNSTNLTSDYRVAFAALVWYTRESFYVLNCFNSSNLFACSGMKRNQFCVFNKQYNKDTYVLLVKKIIDHMKQTGEWGSYFPTWLSPFPFNHTVAFDFYPADKSAVMARGLRWLEPEEMGRDLQTIHLESGVQVCSVTGKPFRIIKQERDLCSLLDAPLPTKSPEARRARRMNNLRPALKNW